jgi:hypothetical protein
MQFLLIVALGLAILTVIFALQNPIPVGVTFLLWKFEGSLALVLVSIFALARSFSEFVDIHSCDSKKKIGDCKSDQENSGAGESVTARDPAVLMKAALRESCFGLFTSETSSG